MTDKSIPHFEGVDEPDFSGVRAVCEPDGYCKGGHRCGRLDIGIRRGDKLNTTNDFEVFTEQWGDSVQRGGWVRLEGGTLDLAIVRESTTWERWAIHPVGRVLASLRLRRAEQWLMQHGGRRALDDFEMFAEAFSVCPDEVEG